MPRRSRPRRRRRPQPACTWRCRPSAALDRYRLVIADGHFQEALSDREALLAEGVEVATLGRSLLETPHAAAILDAPEAAQDDPLVALNCCPCVGWRDHPGAGGLRAVEADRDRPSHRRRFGSLLVFAQLRQGRSRCKAQAPRQPCRAGRRRLSGQQLSRRRGWRGRRRDRRRSANRRSRRPACRDFRRCNRRQRNASPSRRHRWRGAFAAAGLRLDRRRGRAASPPLAPTCSTARSMATSPGASTIAFPAPPAACSTRMPPPTMRSVRSRG